MQIPTHAIIVHGGAGTISDGHYAERLAGCKIAARAGWEILCRAGTALDAVQHAVEVLEDNPWFNAGTGAVLNAAGGIQLDASLMNGATLAAGAVAAITKLKHPIRLARHILEDSRHVLLVGEAALSFARTCGIAECSEQALIIPRQQQRWHEKHGTVGSVALDQQGRLAAGTSTGGLFDALPGRVGDSALIGCGTYADEAGGVSCTGNGEAIIRTVLAKTAIALLHNGLAPDLAVSQALTRLDTTLHSAAGLIMIDHKGRIAHAHNTPHMPICAITGQGNVQTAI